jgi:hypothetical protein
MLYLLCVLIFFPKILGIQLNTHASISMVVHGPWLRTGSIGWQHRVNQKTLFMKSTDILKN